MEFTREPIVETVITPREGFRLVVRSSKSLGQEEQFVEALEVVSFGGGAYFFRSKERPKAFIVPIGDYEVMEVRESRLALKTPIRDDLARNERKETYARPYTERKETAQEVEPETYQEQRLQRPQAQESNSRGDRRRERRRGFRRRRQREEISTTEGETFDERLQTIAENEEENLEQPVAEKQYQPEVGAPGTSLRSLLPPPTTLIRDDLQRLRESELYRGAFFIREEESKDYDDDDQQLKSAVATDDPRSYNFEDEKTKESSQEETFLFHQTSEKSSITEST